MIRRRQTAYSAHGAAEMFALVADVERYPEFVPYCRALRVVSMRGDQENGELLADMAVSFNVFRERFRSRVSLDKNALRIDADYVRGPFRRLKNAWRFADDPNGGSQIDFEIDFEFRNPILHRVASEVLDKVFGRMVEAFVERADDVYGAPAAPDANAAE